jgi:hypothetical protein
MAEYIRFRLSAAKVGASMALLALIGGVAERAQAKPARAEASALFLKLSGISPAIGSNFLKLEQKLIKLNSSISTFEQKLLKFERTVGSQYYKIKTANATFLKITDANARFLKIDAANAQFLKIDDANSQFLKITDANSRFVQGRGGLVTGAMSVTDGTSHVLMGDGSVRVLVGLSPAGGRQVLLENDTDALLNFTVNGGMSSGGATTIKPGSTQLLLPAVQSVETGAGGQLDIQLFGGGGGAGKVWTITVSALGGAGGNTFVGQMLIGLL